MSEYRCHIFCNIMSSDQKSQICNKLSDRIKSRVKMLNKLLINVRNNIIFIFFNVVNCEKLVYSINHDVRSPIWL